MTVFKNLPWTIHKAKRPDNMGGYDWSVEDTTGAMVAETFNVVGTNDVRDARALAQAIADMANATEEPKT